MKSVGRLRRIIDTSKGKTMAYKLNVLYPDPSGQATSSSKDISIAGMVSDRDVSSIKVSVLFNAWPNFSTDLDHNGNLLAVAPQTPPAWRNALIPVSGSISESSVDITDSIINGSPELMSYLVSNVGMVPSKRTQSVYGLENLMFSLDAMSLPLGMLFGDNNPEPGPSDQYDRRLYVTFFAYTETSYQDNNGKIVYIRNVVDSGKYVLNILRKQDWYTSMAPEPTGFSIDVSASLSFVKAYVPSIPDEDGYAAGVNIYVSEGPNKPRIRVNPEVVTEIFSTTEETDLFSEEYESYGLIVSSKTKSRELRQFYKYGITRERFNALVSQVYGVPDLSGREDVPLYFQVAYVVYSNALGGFVEGSLSDCFEGHVVPQVNAYVPALRGQLEIVSSIAKSLNQKKSPLTLVPGTVARDLVDVISDQLSRNYVIQDFNAIRQNISALMAFDDPGTAGSVLSSRLTKTLVADALGISDLDVQGLIDSCFDALSATYGISRLTGNRSRGVVTVIVSSIPIGGLSIPADTRITSKGGLYYTTVSPKYISSDAASLYYNGNSGKYEFDLEIVATSSGTEYNAAVGQVNAFVDTRYNNFVVANRAPVVGGTDLETNSSLGSRCLYALKGVDSGRRDGYMRNALSMPGVSQAKVVRSGDPLMLRDVGSDGEHYGGCVDVYIKGYEPRVYSDNFAIMVGEGGYAKKENFEVSVPEALRIKTPNPNVNSSNPIVKVLSVYNATRSASYDVTSVILGTGEGDSIQLSRSAQNTSIGMAYGDVIVVSYYHLGSEFIELNHHPVVDDDSITFSFDTTQNVSTRLVPDIQLVKDIDPALTGNSSIAKDKVRVTLSNQFLSDNAGVDLVEQTTDEHVQLYSSGASKLRYVGVDTDTIDVKSSDGSYAYVRDIDYVVGSEGSSTTIKLAPGSRIKSGTVVLVDYVHALNITITYKVNGSVEETQKHLDRMSHIQAGVVVKEGIGNYVDIALHVELDPSVNKVLFNEPSNPQRIILVGAVRDVVRRSGGMGGKVNMDDILTAVRSLSFIKRVILPVSKMHRRDGSTIMLESVGIPLWRPLAQDKYTGYSSYITTNPVLRYPAKEGGSEYGRYCRVYENDFGLTRASGESAVSLAQGNFYIRSDGRIVVSTRDGSSPEGNQYRVSYQVSYSDTDMTATDLVAQPLEYFETDANSVTLTIA